MAKIVPDIAIQKRDVEFLQLLLHSRILTLKHAAVLLFGGSREAAKKRIQKLKANGLVLKRRRKAYEQGVLFISKKGFECLKRRGATPAECPDIPSFCKRAAISELTLHHELEVLDVKTAFYREIGKHEGLSIAEFSTWPRLYEFSVKDHEYSRNKIVKPDGFIRIHEKDKEGAMWEHMFFLEVDRSTEKLEILSERVKHYSLFYRQGGMAERLGSSAEKYKDFPFQILLVCKSDGRCKNIATTLTHMNSPIYMQARLSTLAEVSIDPFKEVWQASSLYQEKSNVQHRLRGKLIP